MFRKRTYTQAEADARKTISEGTAILVTAWMPLMLRLAIIFGGILTTLVTTFWLAG
jgi:hypothetical protein